MTALFLHRLKGGAPAAYIDRGVGYELNGTPSFVIQGLTAIDCRTEAACYNISDVYFYGIDGRSDLYFDASLIDRWMIDDLRGRRNRGNAREMGIDVCGNCPHMRTMRKPQTPPGGRIGQLEDELKVRDRRIDELKRELTEAHQLVEQQREQLDDDAAQIDRWIEAFDMVQDADGKWRWSEWIDGLVAFRTKYDALLKEWNRFVPEYNDAVLPRQRPVGRPLGADEEQQRRVLDLRRQGRSLRGIAEDLELGFPTVRTIIDRYNGADRATFPCGHNRPTRGIRWSRRKVSASVLGSPRPRN